MSEQTIWIALLAGQAALLVLLLIVRVQRLEAEPRPTLRDYFAAKAMQGMLANPGTDHSGSWQDATPDALATYAYGNADAMLKARAS